MVSPHPPTSTGKQPVNCSAPPEYSKCSGCWSTRYIRQSRWKPQSKADTDTPSQSKNWLFITFQINLSIQRIFIDKYKHFLFRAPRNIYNIVEFIVLLINIWIKNIFRFQNSVFNYVLVWFRKIYNFQNKKNLFFVLRTWVLIVLIC